MDRLRKRILNINFMNVTGVFFLPFIQIFVVYGTIVLNLLEKNLLEKLFGFKMASLLVQSMSHFKLENLNFALFIMICELRWKLVTGA